MTMLHSPAPAALTSQPVSKRGFTLGRLLPDSYFEAALLADAREGLAVKGQRRLSPIWFYDALGSHLFEAITELPSYYPTRCEAEILRARGPEIAALTGARTLVELGSGSSTKTRLLLDALSAAGTLRGYVGLDVSESALAQAGRALATDYPGLDIWGLVTDYATTVELPQVNGPRLFAFLGSSLGNFDQEQRARFLARIRGALLPGDAFLLGVDLVKDPKVLVAAYDDEFGVTAAFNKNVLQVLNTKLGADFRAKSFDHVAVWDSELERIEMRLRSRRVQTVTIPALEQRLHLSPGEEIRTEISSKFWHEGLVEELELAGLERMGVWTDAAQQFAVYLVQPRGAHAAA